MQIEIWDRETTNGETVTMVDINGRGTQHANYEAAFEYLRGNVREMQAAIDTAICMYLRQPNASGDRPAAPAGTVRPIVGPGMSAFEVAGALDRSGLSDAGDVLGRLAEHAGDCIKLLRCALRGESHPSTADMIETLERDLADAHSIVGSNMAISSPDN
jgi:hypothetical protein